MLLIFIFLYYIDPFRDHFDQYFTKKPASPSNLKPTASTKQRLSNTDLTTGSYAAGSPIPNEISTGSSINLPQQSNVLNRTELTRNQSTPISKQVLDPLGNF